MCTGLIVTEATNFRVPDYTTVRIKHGSIIIYMS